ncbi:S35F1 protein, partial [Polypterus senegalus]
MWATWPLVETKFSEAGMSAIPEPGIRRSPVSCVCFRKAAAESVLPAAKPKRDKQFSGLYLLSFFIIVLGLILYSSSSTYVAQDPRVYKQFRNPSGAATDTPSAGPLEPSVTYTSLGQETEDGPRIRVA